MAALAARVECLVTEKAAAEAAIKGVQKSVNGSQESNTFVAEIAKKHESPGEAVVGTPECGEKSWGDDKVSGSVMVESNKMLETSIDGDTSQRGRGRMPLNPPPACTEGPLEVKKDLGDSHIRGNSPSHNHTGSIEAVAVNGKASMDRWLGRKKNVGKAQVASFLAGNSEGVMSMRRR